jgi:phage terminase large subunit-like protein
MPEQTRNRHAAKKAPAFHGIKAPWASWRGSMTGRRIKFIETQLIVPKGHNAGRKVKLARYQKELIEEFCCDEVRYGLESLPRGNAKSTTMGALALTEVFLNPHSPSVPIVATTVNQAVKAIYRPALRMVALNEELAGRSHVYSAIGSQRLTVPDNDAELFPIANDVDGLQGLDPSLALCDEIGFMPVESWDALRLASGKRPGSLTVGLGTPSDDWTSTLATIRNLVRAGGVLPGLRFIEYAADDGCSVHDRRQWAKANPALAAGILAVDALEADVASTAESVFRCYRLGQWVRGLACWLGEAGAEIWGACESPFRFVPGEPTWAGVDMSLKKDSAAVVLGQRRPDGGLHAVARIWFPQNGLIDASEIMEYLRQAAAVYRLVAAYYDPRYFDLPARMLTDEGLAMVEHPQSLERMTPAVAGTFDAIRKGVLTHDGDPTFTEQVLNAAPRFNEAGFILSKTKSVAKIDAAVAMCMMHRAAEMPTAALPSVFAY